MWFAALLLMLLLVVMACATVYESSHGSDQALWTFYRAPWFKALLALLAVNVAAAVVVRLPLTRRQIGFAITHLSIVLILAGALVSSLYAVDGQVEIAEGQTVTDFNNREADTLTITNPATKSVESVLLDSRPLRGYEVVERPAAPALKLGGVTFRIERYLPDSVWVQHIQEVDDESRGPAVLVSLSASGHEETTWVLAESGETNDPENVAFRPIADPDEWSRLLSGQEAESQPASVGVLNVTRGDEHFEIAVEHCTDKAAPLGDTGYTIRVLRYLPHATVRPGGVVVNASDQPVNPAVEVEIAGPEGTRKRIAWAKFPDFTHPGQETGGIDLTFVSAQPPPVEILRSPTGELYVRFHPENSPTTMKSLTIGTPVETPWPGLRLAVLDRIGHAQEEWLLEVPASIGESRTPALLLDVDNSGSSQQKWVQWNEPDEVSITGTPYELKYAQQRIPLHFELTLNSFHLGTYPGGGRPRSYESQITTLDPASGRKQSHVVSMNHPVEHGGYTLYQSRYLQRPGGKSISYLSVSRDSGKPIVFAGYITLLIGMLTVLATRMSERRRRAGTAADAERKQGSSTVATGA